LIVADSDPWFVVSALSCGILWLVAYALIIRRGFLDRSYGMPLVPLCANFSYELLFGLVWPDDYPIYVVNIIWAVLDSVMVYQYLRFGRDEWPEHYPKQWFYPTFVAVLVMAFTAIATLTIDTHDTHGGNITGWGSQLLLSAGSVYMVLRRNNPNGQSMYIGISRCVGTLSLIYSQEVYERPFMFLRFVYVAATVLDIAYLCLLYRACKANGIAPWRRW
jgi:hypothetical protein